MPQKMSLVNFVKYSSFLQKSLMTVTFKFARNLLQRFIIRELREKEKCSFVDFVILHPVSKKESREKIIHNNVWPKNSKSAFLTILLLLSIQINNNSVKTIVLILPIVITYNYLTIMIIIFLLLS